MAQKTKITNLADRRKKIEAIYSSDSQTRNILRQSLSGAGGSTFNQTTLDRIINSVGSIGSNTDDVSKISNFAYSTEPIYAGIIDYLANMYLWRYYYLPVKIKEKANPKNYEEVYNLMTEIIDGLNIEVTFPTILTKLLKEGIVFLYTEKNTSSKTISTLILNPKFCRPVMMSQYGTGIYQFDAKYFESLGASSEKLEEILELFPKELVEGYRAYKKDSKNQYFLVDGRFGTYVSLNEHHFPTKLAILKNIFDYHRYRENEVERSSATLDKIITHRIPIFENQPIFDLSEVASLHKSMSSVFNKNTRTRLMTTFGEVEIHSLQEPNRVQNETLERGVQGIYQGGGFNTSLFFGGNQDALTSSLTRDASIMWKYIQQLVNFYNLAINNLYNFKGYQVELVMLPITHYSAKKDMESYRKNAEFGIGRLEAIVSTGTKQKHITYKSELEEFLKLEEILKPLKSTHTQSGNDMEEPEESKKVEKEEPVGDENE